jgi:hypothetical protein
MVRLLGFIMHTEAGSCDTWRWMLSPCMWYRPKVPNVEMIAVGMVWSIVREVNMHVGNML